MSINFFFILLRRIEVIDDIDQDGRSRKMMSKLRRTNKNIWTVFLKYHHT